MDSKYTGQEVENLLDSIQNKQDKITQSNKLDYSLLSNTPTIPDSYDKTEIDGMLGDVESLINAL